MTFLSQLEQQFAYNRWANRETLQSLQRATKIPDRGLAIMAHIFAAEWVWLKRLGKADKQVPVWPTWTLEECELEWMQLAETWANVFRTMQSQDVEQEITYTNTKGEHWTNRVLDILLHMLYHGSYHRGQIAQLLGRSGQPSTLTDYIECIRQGYWKQG